MRGLKSEEIFFPPCAHKAVFTAKGQRAFEMLKLAHIRPRSVFDYS
jgi:hypothetical protein